MHIGIFARTFERPSLVETLDAVVDCGLDCIQFNLAYLGFPLKAASIDALLVEKASREIRARNLTIAGVSGTFNLIDPNPAKRRESVRRVGEVAAQCAALNTQLVTLCTGTRDPENMWRHHPDNDTPEAWRDLLESMESLLGFAEKHNIQLGVEPEIGNVISSARKARRLLDELHSPRVKIVFDGANLIRPGESHRMDAIIDESFQLLGRDIVSAHAKDFKDGPEIEFAAPGRGTLNWARLIRQLNAVGYEGPLVLHGLPEADVKQSIAHLDICMKESEAPPDHPISRLFEHDGIKFHYQTAGSGVPFIFQHGLGADLTQLFGLFQPPPGIQMISMDCRAHGQTTPVGPDDKISLASFADDLLALMDHLGLQKAVLGGLSMGAAISLNLAMRHPERLLGLVMLRPAWLDGPRRDNIAVFGAVATLLRQYGPQEGLARFKKTEIYRQALAESPANAGSLAAQFMLPRAQETVARLERIPLDSPGGDRTDWRKINLPTLVMANDRDAIHPLNFGVTLAREIPGAQFEEITPKSIDPERHQKEVQRHLEKFLRQFVANG